MRLWVVFVLSVAVSVAGSDDRRVTHPRAFALAEAARAAIPEFAARGLLQLLDADAIPTVEWRLEIAREVLTLSRAVRHPIGKRLAPGFAAVDSQAALWKSAYTQGLDSLTLSLRAIDHMRRLDAKAAAEAFAELPRPVPAAVTCKDALLDDVSLWYATAARLQADPLPILQSISSPGEIAPAIDLLFARRNTPEELVLYSAALGARIAALPPSDRSFNAALIRAPKALAHFLSVLSAQQLPSAALVEGWRAWMKNGLESPACAESRSAGPAGQVRQDAFDLFNATLDPDLTAELLKPSGEAEAADPGPFADTPDTRRQAELFKSTLFGPHGRALSPEEKNTPEWREQMQLYIQSIESRTRSGAESDLEYFYRQSQLWGGVLMSSPPGPTRRRALESYVAFLLANAPHIDPIVWFAQLDAMAQLCRSLHGAEFPAVLDALRLTGHPALVLYAELETAYPARPSAREN